MELRWEIVESKNGTKHELARANTDGSWWVDWERVPQFISEHADEPELFSMVAVLKLLVAARGSYPEMAAKGGFW